MIRFETISKVFPGHIALNQVSFTVQEGEVHALLGENGAGKSTLLNILHGVYSDYAGDVLIQDQKVCFKNTHDALNYGIAKVHQEVSVIGDLTVGQNVALGYEPRRGPFIDFATLHAKVDTILQRLKCKFKSADLAGGLSTGEMQMLAIAKALFHNARIISFDEPTASLSEGETATLFQIIQELKNNGVTILYVSHRLDEIFKIADRATILRDGNFICTYNIKEITRDKLILSMVGRAVSAFAQRTIDCCATDEIVLEVKNLTREHVYQDVNFTLRKGEILGFAGLVGAKRTDVMRTLFGADLKSSGAIYIHGEEVEITSSKRALQQGIALIPENRKTQGFIKTMTNADNISIPSLGRLSQNGFIKFAEKDDTCRTYMDILNINPRDPLYYTHNLSGGNQQKVILAKWMSTEADVLIFDEPTKGVDVGAKAEIYRVMEELVKAGKSIIMVSSELPEVIGMSDRVMIMHEGKLVKELQRDELSEEKVLHYAMGGH